MLYVLAVSGLSVTNLPLTVIYIRLSFIITKLMMQEGWVTEYFSTIFSQVKVYQEEAKTAMRWTWFKQHPKYAYVIWHIVDHKCDFTTQNRHERLEQSFFTAWWYLYPSINIYIQNQGSEMWRLRCPHATWPLASTEAHPQLGKLILEENLWEIRHSVILIRFL